MSLPIPNQMRPSDPGLRSNSSPRRLGSESESMSPFERANTIPKSNRELEAELPGVLQRSVKLISGIKRAVADMRGEAEGATCYREKCCILLSTAIGASVALDQALYSGNLGADNEQELRMLCTEIASALALGQARIRVYGRQPRWKKYAKRVLQRSPDARFEEVVDKLTELTQQAWGLQSSRDPGTASSRFHLARIRSSRKSSSFSRELALPESPPRASDAGSPNVLPQVLLCRTHLRRGASRFGVKSLLYIPPERSSGQNKPLGQVWWYCSGVCFGRLAVHNVATSETKAIPASQQMPAVVVMAQDIHGDVWTGHKDGYVRIWSESSYNPVCPLFKAMHSDIRCINLDDDGNAWVGSEAGNVKKIELVNLKQPTGGLSKWLEVKVVLKWSREAASSASGQSSTPTDSLSSRAQSIAASALGRHSETAESKRAHSGPLAAISAQGERVWTSGGAKQHPTLKLWSHKGDARCSAPLDDEGVANAIMVMPQFMNIVQRHSPEQRPEATEQATSPGTGAASAPTSKDLLNVGKGTDCSVWQLLTAHENGQCLLWDISDPMTFQPIAKFAVPGHPARALILCEEIGLWGTAHTDGTVELRLLPSGAPDERYTLEMEPGKPVPSVNIPQFRAPFCAHRGGLMHAVGSGAAMVSAGRFGAITLWPEAELRSIAEAAGFVLPTRAPPGVESSGAVTRQATISQVLQRYFTPQSAAMAEYALANAVINRLKHQKSNADEPHLSPIASLSSKEGEEAQIIMEEVAALLRNSASSAGGLGAEQMRRLDSAQSSLMSDLEAAQSLGSERAGSAEGLDPAFLARLGQAPSAPMPLKGGSADQSEEGRALGPVPSMPGSLAQMADMSDAQPLYPGSAASSLDPNFRSTSLHALGGSWTIPFKELVLKKQIGEGSIGKVHLGKWRETDVAVKILNSLSSIGVTEAEESEVSMDAANSAGSESHESQLPEMQSPLATLEREVNIMAALRHPNIVLFMGVCLDPPCVVSEWCARGSLYDVLSKARKNANLAPQLDWTRRLNMALDAAKGLLQLHSKHIIHRDLKSPNLLVDKHWRVKIGDFNLSRVENTQEKTTSITANNPRWLAPEVISKQAYSKAADVFSFGVILWELITWQMPWEEMGVFQIMVSVAEKNQRPDIPKEAEKLPGGTFEGWEAYVGLIQRCWGPKPAERPSFEAIINDLRGLLTESASQTRQRRLTTDPLSAAAGNPSGELPHRSGPLGASDDLPVQPAEAMRSPIDLKDLAQLSQHTGALAAQDEGKAVTSPSGFSIPIPPSEDSQGADRSSMDFRHHSFQSNRRGASPDASRASTDRRRRIQREAALSAHAANDRALQLLSGHKGGDDQDSEPDVGPDGNPAARPAIAGLGARPAQGRSVDLAPHDPPSREALSSNLLSAFARSSDRRFSEDQGRPPLSGRRSTDTEASRSSVESAAGPSGEPPTRMSVERLNRQPPAGQEQPRPEQGLSGSSMAPQSGPGNFRALAKVSEEASSLEKSSGDVSSANKVKGPGLVTDRDGRQSTSSVLGNIHEREHQDQWRSGETSDVAPAESARWRGHGLPEELGVASTPAIQPFYLQPVESGALRRLDPGRQAQPPAEPGTRPSQASAKDTSASDQQEAAVQQLSKEPRTSGTQRAAAQPGAPQQAEPGSQVAGGSGSHSGAKPPPGRDADPGGAGGAGAESPARGGHRGALEPGEQAQPALQSTLREGAGASAGGVRRVSLQGQPGPPGSQQASSSRQGSGATAAPSRAGSEPSERQGMDTADSARSGAGNILSRVVRRSRKVLGLGFRSNKQPSSSGNLSSPTSSKALEGNEGPAGP